MPFVLRRSPIYILLFLVVGGCNQQSNEIDEETISQTDQRDIVTSEQFAQDDDNITPSVISSGTDGDSQTAIDSSEELPPEVALLEEDAVADIPPTDKTSSNTQNIVTDLGFSGATSLPTEPETESYCLNKQALSAVSVEQACDAISTRLASVSQQSCRSAQLAPTGCESAQGFPILISEFAPLENKQSQGRILLIGGTHGDELTSVSVTFRWIEKLNKFHSGLFYWHIVPLMNPDGVLKPSASRTNHNGVDLNRNLPSDDWERNALSYWENKGDKDPRKYPGKNPASESETQWLIDEINTFKPDAIISVHAPYGVVDFDALLLNTAPKSLGKLHLNLLGTYPGSLGNYAGINRDIPVITLELPHSWIMPSEAETSKIWEDIVAWLRKHIDNKNLSEPIVDASSNPNP